jgi:hypothetical protein
MANYYSMEIIAPDGLSGIEMYLEECLFPLETCLSDHGKTVLRKKGDGSDFWFSMGTSDSSEIKVSGGGEVFNGLEFAIDALESLSAIFVKMNFPHIILIDDEGNYVVKEIKHDWRDEYRGPLLEG